MKSKIIFFILLGGFLISRIAVLQSAGSFWFDEMFSFYFANQPLAEMVTWLSFEHNPLFHFIVLHQWLNWFGATELVARSLSLLAGVLGFVMIYFLGKKLFSKAVGLWAAFFFTISTLQLYHQTEARMYALVGLLTLTTLYTFWRWYQKSKRGYVDWYWLAFYLLSVGLLVHTHMTVWAFVVGLWVFWLIEEVGQKGLVVLKTKASLSFLAVNAITVISFLMWLLPVLANKKIAGNVSQGWFFFQNEAGYWLTHLTNFLMLGQDGLVFRSVTALIVVFLFFWAFFSVERPGWWQKIRSLFDRHRWPVTIVGHWTAETRLLFFCFAVPMLIGFVLQITISKYLLGASIVFLLILARGMARLPSKYLQILFAGLLFILVVPTHLELATNQRHNFDKVAEALQKVDSDVPIIVHSFVYALPLRYYGPNLNIVPFYPRSDKLTFEERVVRYNWQALVNRDNVAGLSELIKGFDHFYLVSSTAGELEKDVVKAWLWQQGWRLEGRQTFSGYGDPEILEFVR